MFSVLNNPHGFPSQVNLYFYRGACPMEQLVDPWRVPAKYIVNRKLYIIYIYHSSDLEYQTYHIIKQ